MFGTRHQVLVICILVFGFIFSVVSVSAQGTDYETAYNDYIFTKQNYDTAHSDYLLARAQYQQAQTLASQTKAYNATVKMLQERDKVVITYLTAVRARLAESVGISEGEKTGLQTRIDSEVVWFQTHHDQISSAGDLEDLVESSNEALEHFAFTNQVVHEVLAKIAVGRLESNRGQTLSVLNLIKQKVDKIRQEGELDTSTEEKWIFETENKLTRSLEKSTEAQSYISSIQTLDPTDKKSNPPALYDKVIESVRQSHQFLLESSNFMKEIVRQIKTD